MLKPSAFHSGVPPYACGERTPGGQVTLRVRIASESPVTGVFLRMNPEGEEAFTPAEREPVQAGSPAVWWSVALTLSQPSMHYRFLLVTDTGNYWLTALGVLGHTPTDASDFRLLVGEKPPEWVYDSVFYQIFPDRFANGNPAVGVSSSAYNVEGRPVVTKKWDEPLEGDGCNRFFYCGDLPGITQHLPHIAALGANALYLNPIFTAASNHKYDVADYFHIDPTLGGDEALADLRRATRERDIRLVLDIVPNHCGTANEWFKKAQADAHSPEAEFFIFRHHPDDYECWLTYASLPRLDYRCLPLRERMYAGQDSAFRHWLREPYAIDGWRIDVSNMLAEYNNCSLGHEVARGIRQAVKEENSEAWILGEHFFDATALLQGNEYDASMNYRGFTVPVLQWLCGLDYATLRGKAWGNRHYLATEDFVKQLCLFRASIPEEVSLGELNLLGSHDTPRIMTMANYNPQRVMVAATFMFAYPGVPCIFYGDEIGLAGGCDPYCRQPMCWDEDKWNKELLAHYQALCRLRREHIALRRGSMQVLAVAENSLAFLREYGQERIVVVVGRGAVPACGPVVAAGNSPGAQAPVQGKTTCAGSDATSLAEDSGARCDCRGGLNVRAAGIADGTLFRELISGRECRVEKGMLPVLLTTQLQGELWLDMGKGV